MQRILRLTLALGPLLFAVACEQVGLGPPGAASSPPTPPPAVAAVVDVSTGAGQTYPEFTNAAGTSYQPEALGLNAADRARLWRSMAIASPGTIESGGGAEALVFRGCAEAGCIDGASVVAIDTASGAAFAAVRDAGGAQVLAPSDRVEALLRLNSPSRRWDDPAPAQTAAAASSNAP